MTDDPQREPDLIVALRKVRGSDLERIVHDLVKIGIDGAAKAEIPTMLVGYEAMAQGLSMMAGQTIEEGRAAVLEMLSDLIARRKAAPEPKE
jgi:hypothetical protein